MLRRLRNFVRGRDKGQMLIIFALLIVPVSAAVGIIATDASLWQSERRGAQKDADLPALAGAYELLDPANGEAEAEAVASDYVNTNDQQDNVTIREILADTQCFSDDPDDTDRVDSVMVDLDHESRTLFAEFFGIDVPDIGAHALACAGTIISGEGTVPVEISDNPGPCFTADEEPIYTALCPLEFGAKDTNPRGVIDLQADEDFCSDANASGDLEDLIEFGAKGHCAVNEVDDCDPNANGPWYDCVAVQAGNAKKILEGFHKRIQREGDCDDDLSGVEEFGETVDIVVDTGDPATSLYEARECSEDEISPRLITIIALEDDPPPSSGNKGHPILGFATFYVVGCIVTDDDIDYATLDEDDIDKECEVPGNTSIVPGGLPFLSAPNNPPPSTPPGNKKTDTPTPVPTSTPTPGGNTPTPTNTPNGGGNPGGGIGHVVVFGRFVRLILEGDVGPFDPRNLGNLGITLVE